MSLEKSDLLKLLELAGKEELAFLDAHQRRVQFYASLISAVLGATIAGTIKGRGPLDFALLVAGPVLMVALSALAVGGTRRLYQRFLEAVVVRAKIEQCLGFTHPTNAAQGSYWSSESLLAPRHLKARAAYATSQQFVDAHINAGYHRFTRGLFLAFGAVGVALGVTLVVLALS